jgi:hypothetical protein
MQMSGWRQADLTDRSPDFLVSPNADVASRTLCAPAPDQRVCDASRAQGGDSLRSMYIGAHDSPQARDGDRRPVQDERTRGSSMPAAGR